MCHLRVIQPFVLQLSSTTKSISYYPRPPSWDNKQKRLEKTWGVRLENKNSNNSNKQQKENKPSRTCSQTTCTFWYCPIHFPTVFLETAAMYLCWWPSPEGDTGFRETVKSAIIALYLPFQAREGCHSRLNTTQKKIDSDQWIMLCHQEISNCQLAHKIQTSAGPTESVFRNKTHTSPISSTSGKSLQISLRWMAADTVVYKIKKIDFLPTTSLKKSKLLNILKSNLEKTTTNKLSLECISGN